jgi:hypothetical protein
MSFELLANGPTTTKVSTSSLTYGIDVAGVLATGDTVNGVSGSAAGGGIAAPSAPTYSGSMLKVRITGGTVGARGGYTFTWTTAGSDTDSRTVFFDIVAA